MAGIIIKYVVLPGVIGFALMELTKPSEQQVKEWKEKNAQSTTNNQFSQVLRAAASPGAKPMYKQKPGEQHPVPEFAKLAKGVEK